METKKKKVIITIKGSTFHEGENTAKDIIELVTQGEMYKKRTSDYIIYDETEVSGLEGTTTTLKIDGDKVSVIRLGTTNSHMTFEKGKKNCNIYSTPYGEMAMTVYTQDVNIDYNNENDPINIFVDYNIEIQGLISARNVLDIQVKH